MDVTMQYHYGMGDVHRQMLMYVMAQYQHDMNDVHHMYITCR